MDNFAPNSCRQCGNTLQGRIDKRFCDAYCRNTYNNRNKKPEEKMIQKVNSVLRSNRTILKKLCPTGKATVRKEVLVHMGFNFNYFTSIWHSKSSNYYFCYEYAFSPTVEINKFNQERVEKVLIVQKQEYMKGFNPWSQL